MTMLRLLLSLLSAVAYAQGDEARTLTVELGTRLTFTDMVSNIVNFLARSIGFVSVVLFTVGALVIIVSRGEDPLLGRGKDLVIYSLIGLAVVLGAVGILRTIYYFVYSA